KRLYFHQGLSAGPTLLSKPDGSVSDERRFEPFGQPIEGDLRKDPFNSLNKETNPETGWSYHGARWLAPEAARWRTPDPPAKIPSPGLVRTPWTLHPYQYVNQNPSLYWDPDGMEGILLYVGVGDTPRGEAQALQNRLGASRVQAIIENPNRWAKDLRIGGKS